MQITAGAHQFCGLQEDGAALCWAPAPGATPDSLLRPETSGKFQQITVGDAAFCGLLDDGSIRCGEKSFNGITAAPEGNFIAVAAGGQHACALDAGGSAVCWGRSSNADANDSYNADADADADANANDDGRTTPPSAASFIAIAAGGAHSCGLTFEDGLLCWGQNPDGRADPQPGPFQQLALGVNNTCALRPDGTVFCQGDDSAGQSSPPEIRFTQISLGQEQGCGVTDAGVIECWGAVRPETGFPAGAFTAVSVGRHSVCGLRPAGYAECWGLAQSPEPFPYYLRPANVPLPGIDAATVIGRPVELFSWPDGRIAMVDRAGLIRLYADGSEPHMVLDISDRAAAGGALNMLSAALDPEFDEFPFLYVYYTYTEAAGGNAPVVTARLARFPVSSDAIALQQDELTIMELSKASEHHSGGAIRFGPDRMLYLGIGDDYKPRNAEDRSVLHGSIIRIDGRNASAEQPYRIPDDNPFVGQAEVRPEIWAYGLREPWRMSFDRQGRLWVGDIGWFNQDELSIAVAGANLGWPIFEGEVCHERYWDDNQCNLWPDLTAPVYTYSRGPDNCGAISGALANTRYDDAVFFSDSCTGRVWALTSRSAADWHVQEVARFDYPVAALAADANGDVYVLTHGHGGVFRLDFGE